MHRGRRKEYAQVEPIMSTITESKTIRVPMAGIRFGQSPEVLETLLGSCVGIAVWDELARCGGLAHTVLPDSQGKVTSPGKFVDTAVTELKKRLIERGASPHRLKAKIAGGALMFGKKTGETVGKKNCDAALRYLQQHNIKLVAEHIGGEKGRVIRFSLGDWSVEVEVARQVVVTI